MKRIRKPAPQSPLPAVRAIPPRVPSLVERRFVRVIAGCIGGTAALVTLVGGALHIVKAVETGALPQTTFALAGLAVLGATAAYLAGRSEHERVHDATSDRNRARGRLVPGTKAKKDADAARGLAQAGDVERGDSDDTQGESAALKTKFLDDISQELRAPITSICLAARIIRKHFDSTPEVVAHFGDTLLAEADRLGQTVDEFVELARLESGITDWRDAEVDAADLIQRAVADIESIAVSYGVSVGFTLEPELPPLHVDLDRVTQALTILLASAVRSASEGSEIVIQIAGAHGGWVFTVGGPSFVFPHAEARKVQVRTEDGASTDELPRQVTGRGLGLCLCREIVGHYLGRLWVEGTPGAQGCVRFTLPYRQHRRGTAPAAVAPTALRQPSVARNDAKLTAAPGAAADLEQRRELAVKTLRERAAVQSSSDLRTTPSTSESAKPAAPSDEAARVARPATNGANASSATGAPSPTAETTKARPTAAQVSRPETTVAATRSTDAHQTSPATQVAPESQQPIAAIAEVAAPSIREATSSDDQSETGAEPTITAGAAPVAVERSDDVDDTAETDEVAIEVELDDSPVHAPVSGTMITATHRTAAAPVLAHAGVPAVRGAQSAASAAIQGSDELLLEIAQAQTADGRQLVVSDQVRSLLENAPGTLPAVAGQTLPQAAGARGNYAPSRRRMVAAPWVVRAPSGEAGAVEEPPPAPEDPQVAAAQRARLNERLAKRLGIQRSGAPDGAPGSGGRHNLPRSRRLG